MSKRMAMNKIKSPYLREFVRWFIISFVTYIALKVLIK